MNPRSVLLGQFVVFCLTAGISAYFATILPDTVATHYDLYGHPNAFGSKWAAVLPMPITSLFVLLLTLALPALSPKNFEVTRSGKAYGEVMLLVAGLMGVLNVVILLKAANVPIDLSRWLFAVIFLFFALMGNLMGKIKRNYYMGVRTPWTLSDERVWTQTHRATAHLWFVSGIAGGILTLAGIPVAIMIGYLLVIALIPVGLSYTIYKRLNT